MGAWFLQLIQREHIDCVVWQFADIPSLVVMPLSLGFKLDHCVVYVTGSASQNKSSFECEWSLLSVW